MSEDKGLLSNKLPIRHHFSKGASKPILDLDFPCFLIGIRAMALPENGVTNMAIGIGSKSNDGSTDAPLEIDRREKNCDHWFPR